MASEGRLGLTRSIGQGIVRGMPTFLKWLTIVGTAAMLWVGGSIIIHGLAEMGWHGPEDLIDGIAESTALVVGVAEGFIKWFVKAAIDGVLGIIVGMAIIPLVKNVLSPVYRKFAR